MQLLRNTHKIIMTAPQWLVICCSQLIFYYLLTYFMFKCDHSSPLRLWCTVRRMNGYMPSIIHLTILYFNKIRTCILFSLPSVHHLSCSVWPLPSGSEHGDKPPWSQNKQDSLGWWRRRSAPLTGVATSHWIYLNQSVERLHYQEDTLFYVSCFYVLHRWCQCLSVCYWIQSLFLK